MADINVTLYTDKDLDTVKSFIEENIIPDPDVNCDSMRDHIYENIEEQRKN